MTPKTTDEKIDQLVADVGEIKTVLKGYNGFPGLCEDHENLKKSFYKFRNYATLIFIFLVGSGVLGTGIYKLLELK